MITVAGPYIMLGHLIAAWTRTLRIATKSLGQTHGSERPEPERTGVASEDEVANPFSYIVRASCSCEGEVGTAERR